VILNVEGVISLPSMPFDLFYEKSSVLVSKKSFFTLGPVFTLYFHMFCSISETDEFTFYLVTPLKSFYFKIYGYSSFFEKI